LGQLGLIPERTELLYGQVYNKMPKFPIHSLLIKLLLELVRRAAPSGFHVCQEHPITCADSEPEPDISVIRGSAEDYRTEHPNTAELVIEICVSSHDYDRSKLRAYAGAGVKEVWLVLAPEQQIEIHRLPAGDQYRERILHGPGGSVASTVFPQFQIGLQELFEAKDPRKVGSS
jgi:Uma2 family endonuclease